MFSVSSFSLVDVCKPCEPGEVVSTLGVMGGVSWTGHAYLCEVGSPYMESSTEGSQETGPPLCLSQRNLGGACHAH